MNRGSLKTRFISEVDGDDSENLQKNCYVAVFLILGHASLDSTAIIGREKACRKNTPKLKLKKKRGRKSKAEKAALVEQEIAEVKTRRLEVQPHRNLPENLADLPQS